MDLPTIWFLLVGVLMMGYAILDGFDLGVGILHPLVRDEHEKRLVLNSIGPLWDGNEVWLVTFGGALFAAFPEVYATLLSGFYLPVMVILFSLIGRAISIEFRSKAHSPRWRAYWDFSFFLSSLVVTFVFGLALGNVVQGIPIGPDREFAGNFPPGLLGQCGHRPSRQLLQQPHLHHARVVLHPAAHDPAVPPRGRAGVAVGVEEQRHVSGVEVERPRLPAHHRRVEGGQQRGPRLHRG